MDILKRDIGAATELAAFMTNREDWASRRAAQWGRHISSSNWNVLTNVDNANYI